MFDKIIINRFDISGWRLNKNETESPNGIISRKFRISSRIYNNIHWGLHEMSVVGYAVQCVGYEFL